MPGLWTSKSRKWKISNNLLNNHNAQNSQDRTLIFLACTECEIADHGNACEFTAREKMGVGENVLSTAQDLQGTWVYWESRSKGPPENKLLYALLIHTETVWISVMVNLWFVSRNPGLHSKECGHTRSPATCKWNLWSRKGFLFFFFLHFNQTEILQNLQLWIN